MEMMTDIYQLKRTVARAQLITATKLFVNDDDPYSIQTLACGACEILGGLADRSDKKTIRDHLLKMNPALKPGKLKSLQNQYWNAFKHLNTKTGFTRDDTTLISSFDDTKNDAPLFIGWLDYLRLSYKQPVIAQVYLVWWYATNVSKLSPDADPTPYQNAFPHITEISRSEQKARLSRVFIDWSNNEELLNHPRTEIV